jgi:hypothetical protein
VIALLFGLLSSSQYTRPLNSLSSNGVCSFASARTGLLRHAIKEVSPSKPEGPAVLVRAAGSLSGTGDFRTPSVPAAPVVYTFPESGQKEHLRIPERSRDDSDPL